MDFIATWYCHYQHTSTDFDCILTLHQAPGEAKAELAYLNQILAIDLVLTSDSDIFIFGATHVVQRSIIYFSFNQVTHSS